MANYLGSIDINADPATVFSYLTTDAGMTAWMGQWADLAPEPGGMFAVDIAGFAVRGRYLEVDPPRRVVVSWGVAGSTDVPPASSTVTFTLTPISSGTRVDLLHAGLPDSAVPGHATGWTHFLPRLEGASTGALLETDTWQPIP